MKKSDIENIIDQHPQAIFQTTTGYQQFTIEGFTKTHTGQTVALVRGVFAYVSHETGEMTFNVDAKLTAKQLHTIEATSLHSHDELKDNTWLRYTQVVEREAREARSRELNKVATAELMTALKNAGVGFQRSNDYTTGDIRLRFSAENAAKLAEILKAAQ